MRTGKHEQQEGTHWLAEGILRQVGGILWQVETVIQRVDGICRQVASIRRLVTRHLVDGNPFRIFGGFVTPELEEIVVNKLLRARLCKA
jgi:hypothetical protein